MQLNTTKVKSCMRLSWLNSSSQQLSTCSWPIAWHFFRTRRVQPWHPSSAWNDCFKWNPWGHPCWLHGNRGLWIWSLYFGLFNCCTFLQIAARTNYFTAKVLSLLARDQDYVAESQPCSGMTLLSIYLINFGVTPESLSCFEGYLCNSNARFCWEHLPV